MNICKPLCACLQKAEYKNSDMSRPSLLNCAQPQTREYLVTATWHADSISDSACAQFKTSSLINKIYPLKKKKTPYGVNCWYSLQKSSKNGDSVTSSTLAEKKTTELIKCFQILFLCCYDWKDSTKRQIYIFFFQSVKHIFEKKNAQTPYYTHRSFPFQNSGFSSLSATRFCPGPVSFHEGHSSAYSTATRGRQGKERLLWKTYFLHLLAQQLNHLTYRITE